MSKLLDAYLATQKTDKVPAGYMSTLEWCESEGSNRQTTQRRINALLRAGRMEKSEFRVRSGGIVRSIPHYRLTK